MPCGSGYAHTESVSHVSARSALGAGSVQPQGSLREDPEVAQDPQPSSGPGFQLRPLGLSLAVRRSRRMRMRMIVTVFKPQVVDKSIDRLFSFVRYMISLSSHVLSPILRLLHAASLSPISQSLSRRLQDVSACAFIPVSMSWLRKLVSGRLSWLASQSHSLKLSR